MKKQANKTNRQGFSLITTMLLMAVITTLMAMLIRSGIQRNATAKRLVSQMKAMAYAEAGIEHAYAIISTDFEQRNNPAAFALDGSTPADGSTSVKSAYGNGSFELTITPISNRYVLVHSVGECNGKTAEAEVLLEDFLWNSGSPTPGSPNIAGTAWEDTLFAAGSMTMGGNSDIDGSLHSNGELKMNGNVAINPSAVQVSSSSKIRLNGNINVDGTFTAPSIDGKSNNTADATYNEGIDVPQKTFPEYDLTELYNIAVANGQVIDGTVKSGSDLDWSNVPGGVKWINGDLKVTANANLNCTVVATGYINITGNVNWDSGYVGNHIISRDSTIKIAGDAEISGLLYAPGDITLAGNARIYGQVISGADVAVQGNAEVINYTFSGPTSGSEGDQTPKGTLVGVAAWQK